MSQTITNPNLPPADECAICGKRLEEVGGSRIVAQRTSGVVFSETYRGGGNPKRPHRSFRLYDGKEGFVVVWGDGWTDDAIGRAREAFRRGRHPWFCQVCGNSPMPWLCSVCGSPHALPQGADVLHDDGTIGHCPILGVQPRCVNPKCPEYMPRTGTRPPQAGRDG